MRTTRLAALAALLSAVAVACGGSDQQVAQPVPEPPLPAPLPAPVDPSEPVRVAPDDVQPTLVEIHDGAEDARLRDWVEVFVLDDGRTLELRWWGGIEPCYVVAGVDVEYDEDRLVVGLLEGSAPSDDEPRACPEIARYTAVRVPLDEAVGNRSIVDAADGG